MVAPAGAGPWPQITSGRPLRTSSRITGTSPPGPLRCGSTTWSVNAVAHAASKALPPFSNIDMPTAVAIQWVEVTTPNVPSISGRVVKGLGLMLLMVSNQGSVHATSVYHIAELTTPPVVAGRTLRDLALKVVGCTRSTGLQAKNFALLSSDCQIAQRGDRARGASVSESIPLLSFRHDFCFPSRQM